MKLIHTTHLVYYTLTTVMTLMAVGGCKSSITDTHSQAAQTEDMVKLSPKVYNSRLPKTNVLPKGVIYRTNGDYNDNVAVNLGSDGSLQSFPAPTDVSKDSAPIVLTGGWLLDRRGGVGLNTVFLTYTYSEYHNLNAVPSTTELMAQRIPDAHVTMVQTLPMTAAEAQADTAAVNAYIRTHLTLTFH